MLGSHEEAQLIIEPVIGWRGWNVVDGVFISPDQQTPWPGAAISWDRICRCAPSQDKPASKSNALSLIDYMPCHCGINAYSSPQLLAASRYATVCDAIGQVELQGRVEVFEHGFRAEHARIIKVWASDPTHTDLFFMGEFGLVAFSDVDREELFESRQVEVVAAASAAGVVYGGRSQLELVRSL